MLLFIFIIAILNLGVGYALGKGLAPQELVETVLALLPKRAAKRPLDVDIEEEPLTRPAPVISEKAAPESEAPKRNPEEVLASLASFRNELNSASSSLKSDQADPEKFEADATRLQEVSHAYVEEAEDAAKQLEDLGAAGDAVAKGADRVAEISNEIDGMVAGGLDDEATRSGLVELSEQASQIASEIEQSTSVAVEGTARPITEPTDDVAGAQQTDTDSQPASYGSIDELFDRLEVALADAESEYTHHVAAIRIDPVAGREADEAVIDVVEGEIAKLAAELLAETQTFVPGRPAMVLLDGDSFEEAKERLEKLRQRIESAALSVAGAEVQATVTCAFADARQGDQRDQIIEQLNLALDESARFGSNRIYHHDGAFPTPVDERPATEEAAVAEG